MELTEERINELALLNVGYDRQIRPLDFARAIEREVLAAHNAGAQEPVAWMRDAGEDSISTMTCCCTDAVKQLWLKVNPEQVERYTIPLYAHPQPQPMTDAARDAAWLIEWPAEESMPARWWNPLPNMGWVTDATRAVRFARKDDAEAYIHCGRHQFVAGVIATEHIFDAEIERLDRVKGE